MYRLWCEYDVGQENKVFTSEAIALKWLEEAWVDYGIEDDFDETLGLFTLVPLTIINE